MNCRHRSFCRPPETGGAEESLAQTPVLGTDREQVDQVHVGLQVVGGILQGDQFTQGDGELVHFHNVHFVLLRPVWENDVDGYQVFQVHAKDGDFEALTVSKGPAVIAVIAVGGDELCHFIPVLGTDEKGEFSDSLPICPPPSLQCVSRKFLGYGEKYPLH